MGTPLSKNQGFQTKGIYSQMRHPLYSGIIALLLGTSVITGSTIRVILTLALYYTLNSKANVEEEKLEEIYLQYKQYKEKVPNKFAFVCSRYFQEIKRFEDEINIIEYYSILYCV